MRHGSFWSVMFVAGLAVCVVGGLAQSIAVMALGSMVVGVGYVGSDLSSGREDSVTPLTVHAIFVAGWMGLSHFVAVFVVDTAYEKTFYAYSDFGYLLEAQYLATLSAVVPLLVGRALEAGAAGRRRSAPVIPPLDAALSDSGFLVVIALLVVTDAAGVVLASLTAAPVVGPLLRLGALGAIFMLTWHWFGPNPGLPRWTKYAIIALVVFKVSVAFLYNDMRGEMVYPIYAFFLAVLLRRALTKWMLVGAVAFIIPFSYVYAVIGGIKGQGIVGTERINLIVGAEAKPSSDEDDDAMVGAVMTLAARSCNFGQLSQVARIVDEEGLYYGETISYLVFIFVPRSIWPDKPEVTPGQWFARKLGKGQQISDTRFSNSINMTLAGEFYLNFGWPGAVLGLVAYGLALTFFWRATAIFGSRNNVAGIALAFLLLMQGSYASSAAALPQIVIGYGSMFLAQFALGKFGGLGARPRPLAVPPPRQSQSLG
jgi:hypothetical protein